MFKIGTALVSGVIAAFLAVLSAVSAGARFSTIAGRSFAVFLVVTALVFLVTFLMEKQFPALFAQTAEADIPAVKKGKPLSATNDTDEVEDTADVEEDGETADMQSEGSAQDLESAITEEPVVAAQQGE